MPDLEVAVVVEHSAPLLGSSAMGFQEPRFQPDLKSEVWDRVGLGALKLPFPAAVDLVFGGLVSVVRA